MNRLLFLLFFLAFSAHASQNASPNNTDIIVYTAGDIADCTTEKLAANSRGTADIIEQGIAENPSAIVLTIGDHTYPVGTPEEFENCYQPTWGKFKDRTYPVPGNHEYYSPNAYAYFQYFGAAAGSQAKPYYSFNKGNWHIISMDSNLKTEKLKEQFAWLENDLNNTHSPCILAFWHHPVYSSGLRGNHAVMRPAWKLLHQAKADIVLSGHDHYYERFALQNNDGEKDDQGIREFIVGTGGANLTSDLIRKPNSEVFNKKTHGVLKLTLKPQGYDWEFFPIKGDSFTDQGSGVCHVKPSQ